MDVAFGALTEELTKRLIETIGDFAGEIGANFDQEAMRRQMSVPLQSTAKEVLWFGLDRWPEGIE